jgi:hypothetical protein
MSTSSGLSPSASINVSPPPKPENLITSGDINGLVTETDEISTTTLTKIFKLNTTNLNAFTQKIEKEFPTKVNHEIQLSNYNEIYITSDIHADVRKFLKILISENIIEFTDPFDPYTDDIYKNDFIDKMKFTKSKTLLLILGDLIDGQRTFQKNDGT